MKILMLTLFLAKTTLAAYIPIKGKSPPELHHIITALQTSELYSVHKKEIDSLILQTDRAFSSLGDNDINLIIKLEIFKTLLELPPLPSVPSMPFHPKCLMICIFFQKKFVLPSFLGLRLPFMQI